MKRLVLGVEALTGRSWTGGGIYVRNLITTLAVLPEEQRPEIRLLAVTSADDPAVQELRAFPFVDPDQRLRRPTGRVRRLAYRIIRRFGGNLTMFDPHLAGLDATFPTFGPPIQGAAPIHWMPDFQHLYLPHMFTKEEVRARDVGIAAIAAKPNTLVLSSDAALADFRKFFPKAVAPTRVWRFVSTPPDGDGSDPRTEFGLPERYLYLPNQFWAHKNHLTAFKALARLISAGHDMTLVCTGLEEDHRDPEHPARLRAFLQDNGLSHHVRLLGLVPRRKQVEIFRHASLVVQPSLFEGWSTVIEDAKTLGRPVLASDLPVHREQLADMASVAPARFFDPMDPDALAAAIADLWPGLRAGPEPEREATAREIAASRRQAAAWEFLSIVREAVTASRAANLKS